MTTQSENKQLYGKYVKKDKQLNRRIVITQKESANNHLVCYSKGKYLICNNTYPFFSYI